MASGEESGGIRSYRDLQVWSLGVDLAAECYRVSAILPEAEKFGLTAQIRRAAVSIPANIAEGHGRASRKDFIRFLRMAQGSLKELETHFVIATRVGWLEDAAIQHVNAGADRLGRMIRGLIRSLEAKA